MRALLLVTVTACAAHTPPAAPGEIPAGIAIAVYQHADQHLAIVDDRRTVEVAAGTIVLDRIDPAAPLQALAIEPLDARALRIVACVRDRVDASPQALATLAEAHGERPRRVIVLHDLHDPAEDRFHVEEGPGLEPAIVPDPSVLAPVVRCRVAGAAGVHRVRVLHVTRGLGFTTRHEVVQAGARATVTTRLAFATPAWRGVRATLALFDGRPGEGMPQPLARETVLLDGSTSILGGAPREVAAALRSVYRGIPLDEGDDATPGNVDWGRASHHRVWQWLELPLALAPGAVRVRAGEREVEIAATGVERGAKTTRVPLWVDEDLLGTRVRSVERADGASITDRFELAVANLGEVPREVWIEEPLRFSRRRTLVEAWPSRPRLAGETLQWKLALAPGQTARTGFTITYDVRP